MDHYPRQVEEKVSRLNLSSCHACRCFKVWLTCLGFGSFGVCTCTKRQFSFMQCETLGCPTLELAFRIRCFGDASCWLELAKVLPSSSAQVGFEMATATMGFIRPSCNTDQGV